MCVCKASFYKLKQLGWLIFISVFILFSRKINKKMLNNFKWYRKLIGGNWYYNRYIFDLGRGVIFTYERSLPRYGWSYNIEKYNEEYE